jgi:hypothetical protein
LARHFFQEAHAQQPVFLDVTTQLIEDIGRLFHAGRDDFVRAVKTDSILNARGNVCRRAVQLMQGWRRSESSSASPSPDSPPWYFGYLCLFALAADLEGDFPAHAYYPRLRSLLGEEPVAGTYPHFDDLLAVWDDLETWSVRDLQGAVGIFQVQVAGRQIHVGVPLAQTILSAQERQALPRLLADVGLDPRDLPADAELLRVLRTQGGNELKPRTRRLLENPQSSRDLVAALLTVVRRVFTNWDGTLPAEAPTGGAAARPRTRYGALRLTLRLDTVQGKAITGLRCSLPPDFPAAGVAVQGAAPLVNVHVREEEDIAGWSAPLRNQGRPVDAATLDWQQGLTLRHADQASEAWRFPLRASRVRIFESGQAEGLAGYIERPKVQQGQSYLIACHRDLNQKLLKWGSACCAGGLHAVPLRSGFPADWLLYRTGTVQANAGNTHDMAELAIATTPRLSLRGGIRQDRGNRFFAFAPPYLALEDGDETIAVFCHAQQLTLDPIRNGYALPADLPLGAMLVAEARRDDTILDRVSFTLEPSTAWRAATAPTSRPLRPRLTDTREGAWMLALPTPWHVVPTSELYLLGAAPGQIVAWAARTQPLAWAPVWAVKRGRHGILLTVAYCADAPISPAPSPWPQATPAEIDRWKSLFCHPCPRTRLPASHVVQHLWSQYHAAAR